ncbi:MAG: class I SAM-dependent methyltransferase [Haloferacaceae archaeon]
MDHADPRYLESKRSVDRRALSRRVREALLAGLPPSPRVLEAGCGTGTTVPRLLSTGVNGFRYLGVDRDPRAVAFAREVRPKELRYRGYDATETPRGGRIEPESGRPDREGGTTFAFETGDALARLPEQVEGEGEGEDGEGVGEGEERERKEWEREGRGADLVVAQAFLDVVPLEPAIEAIEAALAPGGLAYLPITFDGGTVFEPPHPADDAVERAYHDAIDAEPGRDSNAGRRALALLGNRDGTLLAANASDWIVRPLDGGKGTGGRATRARGYPADEEWFLARILAFVEGAVDPETAGVSREALEDWLATRRRQLAAGELVYVAHQYDLLYRAPG